MHLDNRNTLFRIPLWKWCVSGVTTQHILKVTHLHWLFRLRWVAARLGFKSRLSDQTIFSAKLRSRARVG